MFFMLVRLMMFFLWDISGPLPDSAGPQVSAHGKLPSPPTVGGGFHVLPEVHGVIFALPYMGSELICLVKSGQHDLDMDL